MRAASGFVTTRSSGDGTGIGENGTEQQPGDEVLSTKVRDDARLLLEAVQAATPLLEILSAFAEAQRQVDDQQLIMAEGKQDRRTEAVNNIHSMYAGASKFLAGKSMRTIFRAAEQLIKALETWGGSVAAEEIAEQVRRFDELLDTFSTSHSIRDGARLMRLGEQLRSRLTAMQQDLAQFANQLDPELIAPGDDVAVIGLFGEYSLREVAEKLMAMDDICDVVTDVLQPYDIQPNFRVRKIETGSLSIEVIAQRLGIIALKRVLKGGVDYWYRNHTREGQLRYGVKDTSAALKDMVKLRRELAKEGVDVKGIDEALAEQSERLVAKIGKLAGLERVVRVDDEMHYKLDQSIPIALPAPKPQPRRLGHDPSKDTDNKSDQSQGEDDVQS